RTMGTYCLACAVSTALMLWIIGSVPLSPFQVLKDPSELARLLLYFAIVTLPFFFAGLAIAVALRAAVPAVNRLYCWVLCGAGLGCALTVVCIDLLEMPRVVV